MLLQGLVGREVRVHLMNENQRIYDLVGVIKQTEGTLIYLTSCYVERSSNIPVKDKVVNTSSFGFQHLEVL